jgi:hypothetical protein
VFLSFQGIEACMDIPAIPGLEACIAFGEWALVLRRRQRPLLYRILIVTTDCRHDRLLGGWRDSVHDADSVLGGCDRLGMPPLPDSWLCTGQERGQFHLPAQHTIRHQW